MKKFSARTFDEQEKFTEIRKLMLKHIDKRHGPGVKPEFGAYSLIDYFFPRLCSEGSKWDLLRGKKIKKALKRDFSRFS